MYAIRSYYDVQGCLKGCPSLVQLAEMRLRGGEAVKSANIGRIEAKCPLLALGRFVQLMQHEMREPKV